MYETDQTAARITRLAHIGIWLSTAAAGLALTVIFYFAATALSDPSMLARELSAQLGLDPVVTTLSQGQAASVTALWLVVDVLGVVLLMSVRQLFVGIRKMGLFTHVSAMQLRRIGGLLLAMAPISILLNAATGTLMQYWAKPTGLRIEISLEDADVYAVVIGLVIVAVGHIMVLAARMSDDHRAIV